MNAPSPLEAQLEAEAAGLREAVARRDFNSSQVCATRYAALFQTAMPAWEVEEARRRLRDSTNLMEWARRHLLAGRARIGVELHRTERALSYLPNPSDSVHTFTFDI